MPLAWISRGFPSIDVAEHDAARALRKTQQADVHARDVEERHGDEHGVVRGILDQARGGERLEDAEVIGVGELHALGMSRRAGGVELDHVVVGRDGQHGIGRRLRVAPLIERRPCGMAAVHGDDRLQAGALGRDLCDDVVIILADEDDFAARVVEHIADFGRGQPPVHANDDAARLEGAEQHLEIAVDVLAHVAEAPARLLAQRDQPVGGLAGARVELAVGGGAAVEVQRDGVGLVRGLGARDVGDRSQPRKVEHEKAPREVIFPQLSRVLGVGATVSSMAAKSDRLVCKLVGSIHERNRRLRGENAFFGPP